MVSLGAVLALTPARVRAQSAALSRAQQQVQAAQRAYDEALERYSQGSVGFFRQRGSQEAVQVLSTAREAGSTAVGEEGDATSLPNMASALELLAEGNEIRQAEGRSALKVSDVLMAKAQSDANWSRYHITHARQFDIGENLAWGYDDPFEGWYTWEKGEYLAGRREVTEHYENLLDSRYQASGFALCQGGEYEITHDQTFYWSCADQQELGSYREAFDRYMAAVNPAPRERALEEARRQLKQVQEQESRDGGEVQRGTPTRLRYTLAVGGRLDLSAALSSPAQYSSSAPQTARVSADGVVQGIAGGSAQIFAREQGGATRAFAVTVTFPDMAGEADWAQEAVLWGIRRGITVGTSATTFSPQQPCTREQALTLLYHRAGSPQVAHGRMPFSDVPDGRYYSDAIRWGASQGLTEGVQRGRFGLGQPATRAQMLALLYRQAGSPACLCTKFFADVRLAWQRDPVQWAVSRGVSAGTGKGTFSPDRYLTRAQALAFLQRTQ